MDVDIALVNEVDKAGETVETVTVDSVEAGLGEELGTE